LKCPAISAETVQVPIVQAAGGKVVRECDVKPDIMVQELMADPRSAGMTREMVEYVTSYVLHKFTGIAIDSTQLLQQLQGAAAGSCGPQVQGTGQATAIVLVQDGDDEEMSDYELTGDEKEASVANGQGTAKRIRRSIKKSLVLKVAKDKAEKSK
jgi:hypothetical protein